MFKYIIILLTFFVLLNPAVSIADNVNIAADTVVINGGDIDPDYSSDLNDDYFNDDYGDADYSDDFYGDEDAFVKIDPIENINRNIFSFNKVIDDNFLTPVARGYRYVVPKWGRGRVSSFIDNLNAPANILNSALQGDGEKVLANFWRFIINSTLGIGGLFDVASAAGLKPQNEDFGQTLAVWSGNEKSDYLIIPLIGSSTNRDAFGLVVDALTNPISYIGFPASFSIEGTKYISKREKILDLTDDINNTSFDVYATVRSAYIQDRANEIRK